jgi:glutathione reductase (NADPH)
MSDYDLDLFVIGAGSGGVRCARMAAAAGARVAIAEERYLGGTCVNVGCVPKKLFVLAAHYHEEFEDAAGFGWDPGQIRFEWSRLRANKDREISRLNGVYRNLLEGRGVRILEGRARLIDPHTVEVAGERLSARHILIATGAWPWVPDFPGREHVVTSNEMFHLEELPRRAVVVGGGYIAVEFAGILNGLGVKTTLAYRGERLLRHFDADLGAALAAELPQKGLSLRLRADVAGILKQPDGSLSLHYADGEEEETDLVLYATGRKAYSHGIGLEECGVALRPDGTVIVDAFYCSSVPSIHAIGDVIGGPELTPLALAQGMALVSTLFGEGPRSVPLTNIPTAVFSQPSVGTVGLSEEEARMSCTNLRIYKSGFRAMKNTLSGNPERTLMKLVVDADTDRVLGAHMVGPEAGEIIQGLAVALQAGATKAMFDSTLGIHPTAAEEFVTMREPVS